MEEMICIELKETTLEKLEAIARWKAKQEGKAVSVEDLVGIAIERHLDRLSEKLMHNVHSFTENGQKKTETSE